MGWWGWGCPAMEKATGWMASGQTLPGVRAVGWVHSVGTVGNAGSRGKGIPGGVVGRVQWGEGGNWEGTGRVWTVYDMGRGSGGLSWEQLGKFFAGGEPESRVDCPLCENLSWGAGCGMQSGVCKVEGWVLAGG